METINVGTAANTFNGEGLRSAMIKVNSNFSEIETDMTDAEKALAESLNVVKGELAGLKEFLTNMILDTAQIDTLNIVKSFNIFGTTNLILSGAVAPAIVPDFIGQQYINTAAGTTYIAKGAASVSDWKQTNNS